MRRVMIQQYVQVEGEIAWVARYTIGWHKSIRGPISTHRTCMVQGAQQPQSANVYCLLKFCVPVSYSRTVIVFVGIRYKYLRIEDERSES